MDKLRIVHIIESLAVEGGGGDRACAELAEAQALNGHDVTILCTQNPHRATPLYVSGVAVKSIRISSRIARKLGWSEDFRWQLIRELDYADIVHCHGTWRMLQVYVRRACVARGVPYIQQPHGSLMPAHLQHRKWFKQMWGAIFERRNLACAAALHAETQSDLDDIRAYCAHSNMYILPCGSRPVLGVLDPATFANLYPELSEKPYILYLGRLDFQKGIDLLISAFIEVFYDQPDMLLVVVGPDFNDTKTKLLQLVNERGVGNVRFFPAITNDLEKKAIFSGARCFVLPSHSENFGITVLESLLARCPVLVSRNTGWSSLERNSGGLVFDPSIDGVKAALLRFRSMSDSALNEMRDRGYKIAEEFDWKEIARKQDIIYRAILSDRGSSQ